MLEYVFRYNIRYGQAGAFRDWVLANDQAIKEHQPPGWTYLGTWFSVRAFGAFDVEARFELESYEALGAGFGDAEGMRLNRELFDDFADLTVRPHAALYRSSSDVKIAAQM